MSTDQHAEQVNAPVIVTLAQFSVHNLGDQFSLQEYAQKLIDEPNKQVLIYKYAKAPIEDQGDEEGWPLQATYDNVVVAGDVVQLHITLGEHQWHALHEDGVYKLPLGFKALAPKTLYWKGFDIVSGDYL